MTDSQQASRSGSPDDDRPKASTLRELVARLSDGTLTVEEASRLNALLKVDPIAQELYLDHMLIDGLLELECAPAVAALSTSLVQVGHKSRQSKRASHHLWQSQRLRSWVMFAAVLAVGVLIGSWLSRFVATPVLADPQRQPIPFVDSGFEWSTPVPAATAVAGKWYGDIVEIVGPESGITPFEGKRMLRFVKSQFEPDHSCELYQLVDLTPLSAAISTGRASVDASALFNALPHDVDNGYAFNVTLIACAVPQLRQEWTLKDVRQLSVSGQQIPADSMVESWQLVSTRLKLPAETTHLLVQVSAVRLSPSAVEDQTGVAGQFVDNLEVALVTRD